MTRPPFLQLPSPACAQAPPFLPLNRRIDAVLSTLRAAALPWILGASGGIDSSAAMLLLARAEVPCLVVHVQHHLRPDAHHDQHAVQVQADQLGLPCYVVHLPPPKCTETENISSRSRRLRYDALAAIAKQVDGQLLTAHHTEDLLETFLLRVQRGTGLAQAFGLQETMHWQGQAIHRPLLALWKSELRQLVDGADFPWIEDSSNCSDAYARNALRHALAPLIEHLNAEPRFGETLAELSRQATRISEEAQKLPSLDALFTELGSTDPPFTGQRSVTNASRAGGWLERDLLRERFTSVDALQQSLYQWCRSEGFSVRRDILADVSGWVWSGHSGQRDAPGLHFESSPLGLCITPHPAQGEEAAPAPIPEFVQLSETEWTSVGTLRLRLENAAEIAPKVATEDTSAPESKIALKTSDAATALGHSGSFNSGVFARPLQSGDRFLSPHSTRLVSVRKRLTRDGVPANERAQAVVLAIPTGTAPKGLERNASPKQREHMQSGNVATRAYSPGSDATHNPSGHVPPAAPQSVLPLEKAYQILGVIYAPGQRVELRGEHDETLIVVSDGSKPSSDGDPI